jgi:HEXXH motif-containing protein
LPDARRARRIDKKVHQELGASLRLICDACGGQDLFDVPALDRLIERLKTGGRVSPSTFADYYELVPAVERGDAGAVKRLFASLAAAQPGRTGIEILSLADPALGRDAQRYLQFMMPDDAPDLGLGPPAPEEFDAFGPRLRAGLDLLERRLPALAAEVRAIISRIVVIGSDPAKTMEVDGGSHYQLWGALFLNGKFHKNDVAVAEVLAHESAHSLLFGFCIDEGLVENDDSELYPSPLRYDPRPMDGIYHSVYVSARMHWAMTTLAADPTLSGEERLQAGEAAEQDRRQFEDGWATIARHGRLTPLGAGLMASARAYMDQRT